MDLLCVPAAFYRVVCNFLIWKDIVRLDTAYLDKLKRERFLSWLAAPGMLFHHAFSKLEGFAWLEKRGCKAIYLIVTVPGNGGFETFEEEWLRKWLLKYGQVVRMVRLTSENDLKYYELHAITLAVGISCKLLERLALENSDLCKTSFVLLQACTRLSHLSITLDRYIEDDFMLKMVASLCPHIVHLHIAASSYVKIDWTALLSRIKSFHCWSFECGYRLPERSPLQELSIGKLHMSDFSKLLKACPELTYLAANFCALSIAEITAAIPHLGKLETFITGYGERFCHDKADASIPYLLCHAKALRRLSYSVGLAGLLEGDRFEGIRLYDKKCRDRILYGPPIISQAGPPVPVLQTALSGDQSPLEELAVSTLTAITLIKLLKQCPRLHTLRMATCPADLDTVPVSELRVALGHVRVLELHKVYVSHMRCLSQLSGLQSVRLSLEGCDGPFAPLTAALMSLASNNSRTLQQLDLRQVFLTIAQLRSLLGQLPLLEEARVVPHSKAKKFKPPTLLELRQVCPRLRSFTSSV